MTLDRLLVGVGPGDGGRVGPPAGRAVSGSTAQPASLSAPRPGTLVRGDH